MVHHLPKRELTHVVGLFDLHFPYEDKRTYDNVLSYTQRSQPNVIVLGGDVVDLDLISNKAKRREIEGKRLLKDLKYARQRLVELREINPDAEIYLIEGNHDERMERYIDDHPEVEGILEVPTMLELDAQEIHWIPSWRKGELLTIGKAHFIHGQYENTYHTKTTVDNYGVNMFYGHIHDVQSYSKILHGDDSTIMAQSCGCLCRYNMPYLKGRPTKWQQAFLDLWVRPDGFFNHQVVSIFNHRFVVNGVEYGN